MREWPLMAAAIALAGAAPAMAQIARPPDAVVVTGEKVERPLQDTPTSVRLVSAAEIEAQHFDALDDVYRYTPNVSGWERSGRFAIRGMDVFGVSGGGNSFLSSVSIDGAVLPQQAITSGPLDLWDVAQVELLRGPQSTLQGRNALAGAIVVRTRDPSYEWDVRARTAISEQGGRSFAAAGGGPLSDDQLAFRVALNHSEFDGFSTNPLTGSHTDFDDRDMARAKALLEPRGLPGFSALLTFSYDDHMNGVPYTYAGRSGDARHIPFDAPNLESTTSKLATLELTYELSEAWSLMSVTALSEVEYAHAYDSDYSPAPENTLWADQAADTVTQEIRATLRSGRVTGVVGGYYYRWNEAQRYGGTTRLSFDMAGVPQLLLGSPPVGLGLPPALASGVLALYAPVDPLILDTNVRDPDQAESIAVYTDFDVSLSERLTLHAGARYDLEKQDASFASTVGIANASSLPDPRNPLLPPTTATLIGGLNDRIFAMAAQATGRAQSQERRYEAFLPKVGATWEWNDELSTSFIVQRGYRPGGLGANIARSSAYTFDPEWIWNYEFAVRSAWLDGRLRASANFFYLDWSEQQVLVQLSANQYDTEIRNAGASHVQGFEFELFYAATSQLDFSVGVGQAHSRFDRFFDEVNGVITDLSGRSFPRAPEWTISAGAVWRADRGFFVSANANYASDSVSGVKPIAPGVDPRIDARVLVNAMAGYEMKHFAAYLYGENLFDEAFVAWPNQGLGVNVLGAGQVFGLRLEARS